MECTEIKVYLSDYVEGVLASDLVREVEAHLQACPTCRREQFILERVPALVRQWSPPVPSEQIWAGVAARLQAGRSMRRWAPRSWMAATLAAAAVVAVVAFLLWNRLETSYAPLPSTYTNYWQAHHQWARSGGASELYPYVEVQ